MGFKFAEEFTSGRILPGSPQGVFHDGAYLHPGSESKEPGGTTKAVVILTDAFGLDLQNCKIIADQLSQRLDCDVWVPDLFDGDPPIPSRYVNLKPRPGAKKTVAMRLRLILPMTWLVLHVVLKAYKGIPEKVDPRVHLFLKKLKAEKGYDKIGAVGYGAPGGPAALRLASTSFIDTAVINNTALSNPKDFRSIQVPTSWICASGFETKQESLRKQAETVLASREGKSESIDYEFREYPGLVHTFAIAPRLDVPDSRSAFGEAFEQTVGWLQKTLI